MTTRHTVASESRTEGRSQITVTEFTVSDGTRWTVTETKTPKPFGFKYNISTSVTRTADGKTTRATLKALHATLADSWLVKTPAQTEQKGA